MPVLRSTELKKTHPASMNGLPHTRHVGARMISMYHSLISYQMPMAMKMRMKQAMLQARAYLV